MLGPGPLMVGRSAPPAERPHSSQVGSDFGPQADHGRMN